MKWTILAAAATLACAGAHAQNFPTHPVTLIVPFSAGGPTDALARIMSERMRQSLGQTLILETVSGAGGTIGGNRVVHATPDGYTIGIGNWTSHVGSAAIYPLQYDVQKDLEPVSLLTSAPLWILGRKNLPAKDARELIAWLKANPDKSSMATVGAGSAAHLCGLYFQQKSGTRFGFVPYRGAAPAIQDLVAGQIDLSCLEASATLAYVQSGQVRAYAVFSKARYAPAPDVPTMDEAGTPGVYAPFWHGFWVPKGTPKDAIAKINAAVVDTFADPAVRERLTKLGQEIPARDQQTPEALRAFHKAEIDKWWPIIKAANIKPE